MPGAIGKYITKYIMYFCTLHCVRLCAFHAHTCTCKLYSHIINKILGIHSSWCVTLDHISPGGGFAVDPCLSMSDISHVMSDMSDI